VLNRATSGAPIPQAHWYEKEYDEQGERWNLLAIGQVRIFQGTVSDGNIVPSMAGVS
jgi:hypothetical protein